MTTIYRCAGCIWEDDCRAADVCSEGCTDYEGPYDDIAYRLLWYMGDLKERVSVYDDMIHDYDDGGRYDDD